MPSPAGRTSLKGTHPSRATRSRSKMDRSSSPSADSAVGRPQPATPRPAATVIVVRDGEDGRPETFMVRRDPRARFAADAFVFPGGAVQENDKLAGGEAPCSGLTRSGAHARLTDRGGDPPVDS